MHTGLVTVRFWCKKCSWSTSGTILEGKPDNTRWCLKCNSQFLHCDKCFQYISGTVKDGVVICDECKKPVSALALVI
jgi:hypothetical protein